MMRYIAGILVEIFQSALIVFRKYPKDEDSTLLHKFAPIEGVYKWKVQFQKLTRNLFLTLHGHNVHR